MPPPDTRWSPAAAPHRSSGLPAALVGAVSSVFCTLAGAQALELPTPGDLFGESVLAVTGLAATNAAMTGRFSERSGQEAGLTQRVSVLRFLQAFKLATPTDGPLAGLQHDWRIGYARYKDDSAFSVDDPPSATGPRAKTVEDTQLLSLGWQGQMPLTANVYARFNPMLHVGRTKVGANFDELPGAADLYRLFNGTYANTAVTSLSLSAEAGLGWRKALSPAAQVPLPQAADGQQPLVPGAALTAEASIIPLYSRSIRVEHPSQRFSQSNLALRAGLGTEYLSSYRVGDRPLGFSARFRRHQFLQGVEVMDSRYINELAFSVLAVDAQALEGQKGDGLTLAVMQGRATRGWRLQLELNF